MKLSRILGVFCAVAVTVSLGAASAPTVTIEVDASDAPRKIFHATLKIPASAGGPDFCTTRNGFR